MKVKIEVRTPQQAAAIVDEGGLAKCEVDKLLDFICKSSSTWSVVAVALRLSPKQAALAFTQHEKRMTGREAAYILKKLPQEKQLPLKMRLLQRHHEQARRAG